MRDQLTQYVNLLFAGNTDAEDIRMEILQNTLDRYDDLIAQGKTPEAAYRLAISGIGDIGELLDGQTEPVYSRENDRHAPVYAEDTTLEKLGLDLSRTMRAIAIGLYILSPIPLIGLDMIGMDVLGVCMTLAIVAAATVLLVLFRRKAEEPVDYARREVSSDHRQAVKKKHQLFGLHRRSGAVLHRQLRHRRLVHHLADLPHHRRSQGTCQRLPGSEGGAVI